MHFVLMMSMTPRGVIVVVAILVIAAIVLSTESLRKRRRIVKRYDLLLRTGHGCLPWLITGSGMIILLRVITLHSTIYQDSVVLMSLREIIALNMSITSVSSSDIDGITAATTETKIRWIKRKIRLSTTSKTLVLMPGTNKINAARK